MWLSVLLVSNCSTSARPFHTGCVTDVPSKATQVVDPASRSFNRERCISQSPISKSKPCAFASTAASWPGFGASAFSTAASPLTRVSVAIQFTSQVFPPSPEKDCSNRQEFSPVSEITNRTRIVLPFQVSSPTNSPLPWLNAPTVGGSSAPALLFA